MTIENQMRTRCLLNQKRKPKLVCVNVRRGRNQGSGSFNSTIAYSYTTKSDYTDEFATDTKFQTLKN